MNDALRQLQAIEQNIIRSFMLVRNDIVRLQNQHYELWLKKQALEERLSRLERQFSQVQGAIANKQIDRWMERGERREF